ncbi:hypothetical protein, partial [Salegentibacter sp.]|uniref:hypothetical protein n=1 Tax=Salegentibacter sp. TaxID=1903072 RepID=UPI00356554D9
FLYYGSDIGFFQFPEYLHDLFFCFSELFHINDLSFPRRRKSNSTVLFSHRHFRPDEKSG